MRKRRPACQLFAGKGYEGVRALIKGMADLNSGVLCHEHEYVLYTIREVQERES